MKFKDILKLESLFKNATERDKCTKKLHIINAYTHWKSAHNFIIIF